MAPGQPLLAIVPLPGSRLRRREFQGDGADEHPGRAAGPLPHRRHPRPHLRGWVESLAAGTGAAFSLLPPENATGNWVKIVQRLPVRIAVDPESDADQSLRLGLSVHVEVDTLAPAPERSSALPPGHARRGCHA